MRKNKDLFSIFPADAGVNPVIAGFQRFLLNIPRGCGGEPLGHINAKQVNQYSPRMRG